MDIQTRQTHLSEMGVPQWHARFVLVGAAKSPKINVLPLKVPVSPVKVEDLPVVGPLGKIENSPMAVQVTGAGEAVESLISEISQPLIKSSSSGVKVLAEMPELLPESVDATAFNSVPKISNGKIPNISLGAFVTGGYVVVSEMGSNISHLEEESLLQNIIRVVDSACSKFEFVGGFNWPVFNSAKVLVGQELLHEVLIARWLASFDLAQARVLMCFGKQSKKIIEDLFIDSPQQLGRCKIVFFNDSLTDLYKVSFRKKDVWKILSENLDKFDRSGEA